MRIDETHPGAITMKILACVAAVASVLVIVAVVVAFHRLTQM